MNKGGFPLVRLATGTGTGIIFLSNSKVFLSLLEKEESPIKPHLQNIFPSGKNTFQ